MGIINQLDFSVANLIAAGEVVDRPASVIKELLENAIDAGADEITVEIKRGGITFMRVTDNGKGIDKEDLPVAIKRHATSKISKAADLDSIFTLGFRGEALAAIAAVSKLRIMSKTPKSETGYILESVGGEVKSINEAGCPNGTTVIVEELFANVPARLKFLKKDITEAMAVSAYVERIALSRPDIAIRFIVDGNMKLMTTGDSKLYNVIYILLGRDFAKKMLPVDNKSEGLRVHGYIGTPDSIRANRNFQFFFINNRFVKSKTVSAALEQAFATFIPSDKFPCAILNIDVNPALVDVNVHPAKLEVKFSNERAVFEAVYATVRQALENNTARPEFSIGNMGTKKLNSFIPVNDGVRERADQLSFISQNKPTPSNNDFKNTVHTIPMESITNSNIKDTYTAPSSSTAVETKPAPIAVSVPVSEQVQASVPVAEPEQEERTAAPFDDPFVPVKAEKISEITNSEKDDDRVAEEEIVSVPEYRIIGEAFYSYVIVEKDDTVLIIDKHAAHERIIFEELKKNLKKSSIISQMLLVPIDVVMVDAEIAAVTEFEKEIKATGFEFTVYGNTVSITEVPAELESNMVVSLIETMAGRLSDGTGNVSVSRDIVYEKALFQASCKAAVKIGHVHDPAHIKWIVEKVLTLDIIKFCPHGRPVALCLTKHDFERQFKRT